MQNKQNKSIAIGTEDEPDLCFKTTEERCDYIENKIKHENCIEVYVRKHPS
jgi:hypothetical protein